MSETVIAGRYRLVDLLGRGGMSEVWRAEDLELGRTVALKLLAPDADRARFEREARAAASLNHPNVTQVFDYGESDGRPYIVLEHVPGGTLEDRLATPAPLPDDEAYAVAAAIAAGLAHAHQRGVVHRDLKPANVLFDEEGRAKLADFGIARLAAGEGTLTEAGTVLGTAAYISPEQATGDPASAASDVYSWGVIVYRLLTGRLPFESNDPMELVLLHRDAPPPPLERVRPEAPSVLASAATRALAKDPANRPADGGALLAELGGAPGLTAATTAVRAHDGDATRVLPAAPPPSRRSRAPLLAAVLLVLLLAGGALAYALTRPAASDDTATFAPVTLPKKRPTTQAQQTTTAPATSAAESTTEQTTTQPAPAPPPTTAPPAPTTAPAPTTEPPTTATEPPTTTAPPPTDTAGTTVTLP